MLYTQTVEEKQRKKITDTPFSNTNACIFNYELFFFFFFSFLILFFVRESLFQDGNNIFVFQNVTQPHVLRLMFDTATVNQSISKVVH